LNTYVAPRLVNRAIEHGLVSVVEDVMPSVVYIRYEGKKVDYYGRKVSWQGSGVILDENGLILTARHVVNSPGTFTVILSDGREFVTEKACVSREYDVGFLKIDAKDLLTAKFGDSDKMRLGSRILAIGSPWGKQHLNSVTLGVLSALNRTCSLERLPGWEVLFQTDVAANPGNSGGPVFCTDGRIVGIVVGLYGPGCYAGVTYCVPSNICRKLASRARITLFLQDVVLVEANERFDKLEDRSKVVEEDIYDIENRLWDLEEGVKNLEFEVHRPFNGIEWEPFGFKK
ncbi:trypsin-like peptidase domain-containing protein, partial [bacterium]|nr:trypsin-like peptidase domain-containing protein [bacterium]